MGVVRVIIVDDNAGFLESARTLLDHHPRVQVVGVARSGQEGVRLAAALAPDLVLMDLAMPGMGGITALRAIKAQLSPPCVVIVTFYDSVEDRRIAAEAGADVYIRKDRFVEDVFAVVDAFSPPPPVPPTGEPQV